MPNGTGSDWDILSPADADPRRDGANEIRVLREGVGDRLAKEHVAPATADVGGEHLEGSAKVYVDVAAPIVRPDGATPLNADDAGRMFIDTNGGANLLYFWDGTAFVPVQTQAPASTLPDAYFDFTGLTTGVFSPPVTLDFVPRRVVIFNDDGSAGWSGTFIIPATPLAMSVYLRILKDSDGGRVFELKRSGVDGKTLELKYTGADMSNFNGTWQAFAAGIVA